MLVNTSGRKFSFGSDDFNSAAIVDQYSQSNSAAGAAVAATLPAEPTATARNLTALLDQGSAMTSSAIFSSAGLDAPTLSYSTAVFPYNCVVLIETSNPGDPTHFEEGSGVVIGPHTILTASHMLWDSTDQSEANQVSLYPAFNQIGIPNPPGSDSPLSANLAWHNYEVGTVGAPTISQSASQFDYAVIDTSYTFTSWMGVLLNYNGGTVHLTGYPGTSNGIQTDVVGTVSKDPNYSLLDYGTVSASPGNSGGPLWLNFNGSDDVCGVVSTGSWACQLTSADWTEIQSWESADSYLWQGSPTSANPYDFNGDGFGDILLQSASGQIEYANMAGGSFQGMVQVANTPGWTVVGAGKVAGNADSDIVILNNASGEIFYRDMLSGGASHWVDVTGAPGYAVFGVGDINHDGFADIVIQNHSDGTILWANMANGVFNGWKALTSTPGWNVVGVADVNDDGFADVLIQNQSDGTIFYGNMAGGAFNHWVPMTGSTLPGWKAVGAGDIMGNGYASEVIQESNGSIVYANMTGGVFHNWLNVGDTPGWNVIAVEDVLGNGYDDIVIQNASTGDIDYADMTGGTFQHWVAITTASGFTGHTGPGSSDPASAAAAVQATGPSDAGAANNNMATGFTMSDPAGGMANGLTMTDPGTPSSGVASAITMSEFAASNSGAAPDITVQNTGSSFGVPIQNEGSSNGGTANGVTISDPGPANGDVASGATMPDPEPSSGGIANGIIMSDPGPATGGMAAGVIMSDPAGPIGGVASAVIASDPGPSNGGTANGVPIDPPALNGGALSAATAFGTGPQNDSSSASWLTDGALPGGTSFNNGGQNTANGTTPVVTADSLTHFLKLGT